MLHYFSVPPWAVTQPTNDLTVKLSILSGQTTRVQWVGGTVSEQVSPALAGELMVAEMAAVAANECNERRHAGTKRLLG